MSNYVMKARRPGSWTTLSGDGTFGGGLMAFALLIGGGWLAFRLARNM